MRVRVAGPYRGIVSRSGRAQGAAEASIGRGLDPRPIASFVEQRPAPAEKLGFHFYYLQSQKLSPRGREKKLFPAVASGNKEAAT